MKVWMASIAVRLALVQLGSALWLYGRLPLPAGPPWLGSLHRISGRLAFLASLPVALTRSRAPTGSRRSGARGPTSCSA